MWAAPAPWPRAPSRPLCLSDRPGSPAQVVEHIEAHISVRFSRRNALTVVPPLADRPRAVTELVGTRAAADGPRRGEVLVSFLIVTVCSPTMARR